VYSAETGIQEHDLRAALAQHLAPWELPRRWWRRDTLDTDARGKRSRSAWRDRTLNGGRACSRSSWIC
jgi:acyl-CoA synthetase (AMP-forming)/AMP-acid ligase II